MALFSIERFIVVIYPLKKYLITGKKKHKKAILYITLFSLVLYSFSLKTSGLESNANEISCVTLAYWFKFANVFAFIDGFLTMFLPFCIIFISNVAICIKLLKTPSVIKLSHSNQSNSPLRKLRVSFSKKTSKVELSVISDNVSSGSVISRRNNKNNTLKPIKNSVLNVSLNVIDSMQSLETPQAFHLKKRSLLRKADELKRKTKYHKTTRLLFIVSFSFCLLNTPMYLCKLYYYLRQFNYSSESAANDELNGNNTNFHRLNFSQNKNTSTLYLVEELDANTLEEIMERITCFLYYLNFSLNFFLYSFCTKDFRQNFFKTFKGLFWKCMCLKISLKDEKSMMPNTQNLTIYKKEFDKVSIRG